MDTPNRLGPVAGIEEDTRDQKPGKNEEQVYSENSRLSRPYEKSAYAGKGQIAIFCSKAVEEGHAENSNSAQQVELGHEAPDPWFRR